MKVRASVKPIDPKNDIVVRRCGRRKDGSKVCRVYIINKKKPKNKQRQG
ncbi:MAG: 50S ribosomal protein L36 [Candidatus Saccharibacteria bacterium]|nr:50S ribosomal protein L36 [Candidatus Saccharibacteria bacterium]